MFLKFSLAALPVLLILTIWLHRRLKRPGFTPYGMVKSTRLIRQLLYSSINARSVFDLYIPPRATEASSQARPTEQGRLHLRCVPLALRPGELLLETLWEGFTPRTWKDRSVTCYFSINANPGQTTPFSGQNLYYTFDTSIKDMEIKAQGCCRLRLRLPHTMRKRQKRSFARFEPPREYLLGAALWGGKAIPPEERRGSPRAWPRPTLVILPEKAEQFHLNDLSAGGCKLLLSRGGPSTAWSPVAGEEAVLFLDLLDPDVREGLRFWLHCRVRNAAEHTEGLEAGLQFISWGKGEDVGPGSGRPEDRGLLWLELKPDADVPGLAGWIARRQIELAEKEV